MKNIIIAMLVTLTAFAANAEWEVKTYQSSMTDKNNGHALLAETEEGAVFTLGCMYDGTENITVAAPDYLGFSPMMETVYAVDGMRFYTTPLFKKARFNAFLVVGSYHTELVSSMLIGKELRFMQLAEYQNSKTYTVSLDGFVEAYKEWGRRCSEFY